MRRRILDAAHELLHAGGPDAVSVRRIAQRVGVSHMALYTYFSNREAMLQALREEHTEEMLTRRREHVERARQGECVPVLREELTQFARFADGHPHAYRLMFLGTPPERAGRAGEPLRQGLQLGTAHLAELIEIGIQQHIFAERDARVSALTLICMVSGALMLRAAGRLPDDAPFAQIWADVVEQAIDFLMKESSAQP